MSTSFHYVNALTEQQQRDLLDHGDPPERLWAAWALAQRLGAASVPSIRDVAADHIPDGMRQQLLVVLAGFGEPKLLAAVASQDPSDAVRATSVQYYIRTAPPGDPDCVRFACAHLKDPAPRIPLAVLFEHRLGRLTLPTAAIVDCLSTVDAELRLEAFACLAEVQALDAASYHAAKSLLRREMESNLPSDLLKLAPRQWIVDTLAEAAFDPAGTPVMLTRLAKTFGPFSWSELQPLSEPASASLAAAVLRSVTLPFPDDAVTWLARAYLTLRDAGHSNAWRAENALRESLTDRNASLLTRSDAQRILQYQLDFLAELPALRDEYDDWDWEDELLQTHRVIALLRQAP